MYEIDKLLFDRIKLPKFSQIPIVINKRPKVRPKFKVQQKIKKVNTEMKVIKSYQTSMISS